MCRPRLPRVSQCRGIAHEPVTIVIGTLTIASSWSGWTCCEVSTSSGGASSSESISIHQKKYKSQIRQHTEDGVVSVSEYLHVCRVKLK